MQHSACPACSSSLLLVHRGYLPQAGGLAHCRRCDLRFALRLPSHSELAALYNDYTRDDWLSPLTQKRYTELLHSWQPYRRLGRLLDRGCGVGLFLQQAQACHWEACGTEYTEQAVAACRRRGVSARLGELPLDASTRSSFDVVTSFEVLEHLSDPRAEVEAMAHLVRHGGVAYVTTPNFHSLSRRCLGPRWRTVITYPEHLCYFTPASLRHLFESHGFATISVASSGFSLSGLRDSLAGRAPGAVAPDTADEQVRRALEGGRLGPLVKTALNGVLNAAGAGDSLKGLFLKL